MNASRNFESFSFSRAVRKIQILNDRFCVLWAGSVAKAKSVLEYLSKSGFSDPDFSLKNDPLVEIAKQYSERDLDQNAFIFVTILKISGTSGKVQLRSLNCQKHEDDNFTYVMAGSGACLIDSYEQINWYKLRETEQQKPQNDAYLAYTWLARALAADLKGDDVYKYLRTGFWYEITTIDECGLRAVPYLYTTFHKDISHSETVYSEVQIKSHYENGLLFLFQRGTRSVEIDDKSKRANRIIYIPSLLKPKTDTKKPISLSATVEDLFLGADLSIISLFKFGKEVRTRHIGVTGDAYSVSPKTGNFQLSDPIGSTMTDFFLKD